MVTTAVVLRQRREGRITCIRQQQLLLSLLVVAVVVSVAVFVVVHSITY